MIQNFSFSVSAMLRILLLASTIGLLLPGAGKFTTQAHPSQTFGAWVQGSSMNVARSLHSSTRLDDGRVLVAGGLSADNKVLTSSEIYDPATGVWSLTGNLNEPRSNHSAVLLKDGRVLLVSAQSAEVFTPATGKWASAGAMALTGGAGSYEGASVTLLPNGKVLVAGGRSGSLSFARGGAELFDPSTGNWTATSSLNYARQFQSATLLPNGKVLIAGGVNRLEFPPASELYDPATGQWTLAASPRIQRSSPITTFLPNGRVLLAGGSTQETARTAELFNPTTGTWSGTGNLNFTHNSNSSTVTQLSDGRVLVVDSQSEIYDFATGKWSVTVNPLFPRRAPLTALPNGKVLLTGGSNGETALQDVELFDPSANLAFGVWNLAQVSDAGQEHTATLLADGRVLVSGGLRPSLPTIPAAVQSKARIFDLTLGWLASTTMNTARYRHTATLLPNGQVLVAGGESATFSTLLSTEVYDPTANSWRTAAPMSLPRRWHKAALLPNGKVLVVGGANDNTDLNGAELYDSTTDRWTTASSMGLARRYHSLTLLADGKVLVVGGENNGAATTSAEIFDPATGMWRVTGTLKTARRRHTATLLPNGKVLVTGGDNGGLLESAELFDPATEHWIRTGSLGSARQNHTATLLADGQVLIAGGAGRDGRLNSAEIFDPAANNVSGGFSSTKWLNTRRELHSATKLPDGRVLVLGGIYLFLGAGSSSGLQAVGDTEIFDPKSKPLPTQPVKIAPVSASSFQGGDLAGDSIIAIFGERFSNTTAVATTTPLPLTLGNVRVSILQQGGSFPVPLFFVSPNQINCQLFNAVTQAAPRGAITLSVTTADGTMISEPIYVTPVVPSLFSADSTGKGLAAAVVLRIKANGEQVYEPISRFDPAQSKIVAIPVDLSNANEQAFLILYGTGWRNRSSLSAVSATVGGAASEIIFAGQQGDYVGLDQANLRLPTTLAGRGEVDVRLTVDGIPANAVTVVIK